jgi:Ca2+/Na+ antiporter
MIKKGIIWFLVLAFLNFIIVPDYVFAGGSYYIGPSKEDVAIGLGAAIVLVLIIVGIVALVKHSKSPNKKPQEQKQDTEISPDTNLDNQLITPSGEISLLTQDQKQDSEMLPDTNLDNQLITPSGEIVLVQW